VDPPRRRFLRQEEVRDQEARDDEDTRTPKQLTKEDQPDRDRATPSCQIEQRLAAARDELSRFAPRRLADPVVLARRAEVSAAQFPGLGFSRRRRCAAIVRVAFAVHLRRRRKATR
jgi:hypothetical protein